MLATQQFRLVMTPERKKQLAFLAKHDGRSMAKIIDRLVLEKYQAVKGKKIKTISPRPEPQT